MDLSAFVENILVYLHHSKMQSFSWRTHHHESWKKTWWFIQAPFIKRYIMKVVVKKIFIDPSFAKNISPAQPSEEIVSTEAPAPTVYEDKDYSRRNVPLGQCTAQCSDAPQKRVFGVSGSSAVLFFIEIKFIPICSCTDIFFIATCLLKLAS